jgi:hypothetical protein
MTRIDSRWSVVAVVLLGMLLTAFVGGAAAGPSLVIPGQAISVVLDVDHCTQSSTLCTGSASVGAAASGNDSIVAVYVQVAASGLAETDFALGSITNAAPGVTPAFVTTAVCAACFAEPQPGVYRLAARPSFGFWGSGTYVVQLTVTLPAGAVRRAVVPIDIP